MAWRLPGGRRPRRGEVGPAPVRGSERANLLLTKASKEAVHTSLRAPGNNDLVLLRDGKRPTFGRPDRQLDYSRRGRQRRQESMTQCAPASCEFDEAAQNVTREARRAMVAAFRET